MGLSCNCDFEYDGEGWNWGDSIKSQSAEYRGAEAEMMADPEREEYSTVEDYL